MLQVHRTISDILKALQVLAKFLKFLVSVADILEALQLRAKILKFPTFVTDFLGAGASFLAIPPRTLCPAPALRVPWRWRLRPRGSQRAGAVLKIL